MTDQIPEDKQAPRDRAEVARRLEVTPPLAPAVDLSWLGLLHRYGAWALLVFYLLGAIPGLTSPVDKIANGFEKAMSAHNADTIASLEMNRQVTRQLLFTMRALCERTQQTRTAVSCGRD